MSRFLSEALNLHTPAFRLGLRQLEAAHGFNGHDIRVSTDIRHQTIAKLHELGLDGRDTTAQELYHVLQEKVRADDKRLTRVLQTRAATYVSAEAHVTDGIVHALNELAGQQSSFAIKSSVVRAMLTKQPPKKAMKQLGYRSVTSMVKHEQPALMVAAGWLYESRTWQKGLLDQYKKLKPSDFETREVSILQPVGKRWEQIAHSTTAQKRHNIMSFTELGTVIVLPLPAHAPSGTVIASTATALHELNEIRATSTYLKFCQVRPDFGLVVQSVATSQPQLHSRLLDQPVSWHLIQQFYGRLQLSQAEALEPHLQLSELSWQPLEDLLVKLDPGLSFWKGTSHLGLLHNGHAVSLNIFDAALNACNHLPFEQRIARSFRQSVWHELLLRYLKPETVEQSLLAELQPKLAYEPAVN